MFERVDYVEHWANSIAEQVWKDLHTLPETSTLRVYAVRLFLDRIKELYAKGFTQGT
jgi:hypothetical protein